MSASVSPRGGPVLVTGGAGYIGSHTTRLLSERGIACVVLDNLSTGHRAAVQVPFVEADLGDVAALGALMRAHEPSAVIHFAARTYVGESVEDPGRYYRENVVHTWNLLEAMRAHDVRHIVFSSTCATYGDPVESPMTERHPQVPISPYGRTKLHMEHMMQDYARAYGMSVAALRYFNAAGAHPSGEIGEVHEPETHLIPLVLQVAAGKRAHISIFGDDYPTEDGTCIRDYVHVCDLADAHARALDAIAGGARDLRLNLGTGTGYSVKQVVECARKVTGHAIPAKISARRPGDPPRLVSGGSSAREVLGWTPERADLETIVADAWKFQRAHPLGYAR
jgi:UDP-glucose-4-epimerase GalE